MIALFNQPRVLKLNDTMKKVLIIYAKTGGGHLSLAQALEESLNQTFPHQFEILLYDPFPKIYASSYKTLGTNFQNLWGKYYKITDHPSFAATLHKVNQVIVIKNLKKTIRQFGPELVISTFSMATQEVVEALERNEKKSKIAIAIADPFTPHATWFSFKGADLYLSPTPEVTQLILNSGIEANRVKTVGWLVRQQFRAEIFDRMILRKVLGLDPEKFIILLGGSGQGGGDTPELVKRILDSKFLIFNSQFIIVAGSNPQLMAKLMKLTENFTQVFHLYPYTNNMPQLMAASDIIVGKAGPNLLFEAIFLGKPFLATGCLPGQEEGNLEFIKRENLGWVESDPADAIRLLENLSDPSNLDKTSTPLSPGLISEKRPNLKRVKEQNWDAGKKSAWELNKLFQN